MLQGTRFNNEIIWVDVSCHELLWYLAHSSKEKSKVRFHTYMEFLSDDIFIYKAAFAARRNIIRFFSFNSPVNLSHYINKKVNNSKVKGNV